MKNHLIKYLLIVCIIIINVNTAEAVTRVGTTVTNSLNSGLIGWWTFDGKDLVNNAVDKSGTSNTGRLVNFTATSSSVVAGNSGQALKFDGVDDYVGTSVLNNTSTTTISAWIKVSAYPASGYGLIAGFGNGNSGGTYDKDMSIDSLGKLYFYIWTGAPKTTSAPANAIPRNQWVHVAATADDVNMYTYVNGVQVGSVAQGGKSYTGYTLPNIVIGGKEGSYNYMAQSIDDVRVYNRALSAAEIAKLYNMGKGRVGVSTQLSSISSCTVGLACGLVGYWTFDGKNLINNVTDSSGNGNNGYMSGFTSTSSAVVAGKVGQAIDFDGSNDYVNVGDVTFLDNLTSMSFSFWIYRKDDGWHGILGKWVSGNGPLLFANSATLYWQIGDVPNRFTVANAVDLNKWVHIVAVENNNTMNLYKNGILQSGTATAGNNTDNAATLKIGLNNDGSTGFMHGYLDDVRIYNRALSATEVMQLYKLGSWKIKP